MEIVAGFAGLDLAGAAYTDPPVSRLFNRGQDRRSRARSGQAAPESDAAAEQILACGGSYSAGLRGGW